ncbi:MAG: YitT family protein [Clostridia bacterium]|nr:YitT family protein [Clostridia bacterium]
MKLSLKMTRKELLRSLRNTALVVLGTCILAFGVRVFIIPFDLVTGGVTGIGILLKNVLEGLPFFGTLSSETYITVVNTLFFFIGLFVIGKAFALKTLVSAIVYPLALFLISLLVNPDVFGGFLDLTSPMYADYHQIAKLLAAVFGGAFVGAGVAITFLGGGSTGGVDIIALTLCRIFKKLKSSVVLFCIDSIIILLGVFGLGDLVLSLLGIVSALVCAVTIDRLFVGQSRAFTAHIISEHHEKIKEAVRRRMRRTTTVTDVVGGYSGEHKKMLTVTFSMNQYAEFTAILASVDKNAFVTVNRAHEINGEGWTYPHIEEEPEEQSEG